MRCEKQVIIPGMNFTRFRQCSRNAVEGSGFCKQHGTPKAPKVYDPAIERAKTLLYLGALRAKNARKKAKDGE